MQKNENCPTSRYDEKDLIGLHPDLMRVLRDTPPPMDEDMLRDFVGGYVEKAGSFREIAREYGSPLYILDPSVLKKRLSRFREAFSILSRPVEVYYAVKSNNMPEIAGIIAGEGAGLDVSSGRELRLALKAGAKKIMFSGPGKTDSELSAALDNSDRVTVLIDSFGELDRLGEISRKMSRTIKAGVRLTTVEDGLWRKFGIPLAKLRDFFVRSESHRFVRLEGIQFHTSWNLTPDAQTAFLGRLGGALRELPESILRKIGFIDIGGGYWPEHGEWLRAGGTPSGALRNLLSPNGPDTGSRYLLKSREIEDFVESISAAIDRDLPGMEDCAICVEPGRWLCHASMHILMTVVDLKDPDIAITDAGTNAVGWERFEHDFFPVINLSQPGVEEHRFDILGSLCTPHDLWGYSYHGRSINRGDMLLIPTQGAYTYSLRQEFIKELPKTVVASIDQSKD